MNTPFQWLRGCVSTTQHTCQKPADFSACNGDKNYESSRNPGISTCCFPGLHRQFLCFGGSGFDLPDPCGSHSPCTRFLSTCRMSKSLQMNGTQAIQIQFQRPKFSVPITGLPLVFGRFAGTIDIPGCHFARYHDCSSESSTSPGLLTYYPTTVALWHAISHSRPHSPSEAGRKTRPLAIVTQRVTATLIANRVPLGCCPQSPEKSVKNFIEQFSCRWTGLPINMTMRNGHDMWL